MTAPLVPVPTLDEIAANPALVGELPPHVCAALAAKAAGVGIVLAARLAVTPAGPAAANDGEPEPPLTVEEAARRLGIAKGTLYRKARTTYADLLVRTGTAKLLFDARALEDYKRRIRRRQA